MDKEISFLKCEKCSSGELDTIENFEKNTFQVKCKKCGHVLHEGPIFLDGPSFIEAGEEVEDIPQLTKNEIKKLNTKQLFEKYYFGEVCDKYFVDEIISRLIDLEKVIKLIANGVTIKGAYMMEIHSCWTKEDYALMKKTFEKFK